MTSQVTDFTGAVDFLSRQPVEAEFIVKSVLPVGGFMHLFAREGVGKTRLAWQLAYAVAEGQAGWAGLEVRKRGAVLFLELDMAPSETRTLLQTAERAGLLSNRIIVPEQYLDGFNVLEGGSFELLRNLQREHNFALAVVDAASDCYQPKSNDVNQDVKTAMSRFRLAFPQAGIVFINHNRKPSQYAQAKGVSDSDSYLGPTAWNRKASTAFRLTRGSVLKVDKRRHVLPFSELKLRWNEYGFFEIDTENLTAKQALVLWPNLPGIGDPSQYKSIRAVCRSIAGLLGLREDSVRKVCRAERKKGVAYPWLSGVTDDE